jgi:sigma-B regulation protein RsbU (phosphoserine phosphatase)
MVQSIVSALARENPQAPPSDVLRILNRVLYENIRHRLGNNEHVTLTLLRYRRDGVVLFAGAHEEIVVCRAATGRCELIPTPGPWVGAVDDIDDVTVDSQLALQDGDVMVLYSDGITEARNAGGAMLGIEPVIQAIESLREEPVERIRDEILDVALGWAKAQEDDISLMVLRYHAQQTRIA